MQTLRHFALLSLLASCAGCATAPPASPDPTVLAAGQRPEMLMRLGDDMRRNGDPSGALGLYRAAAQADPRAAAPLERMGEAFLAMNEPAQAEQAFRGELVIDHGSATAERGLALALLAQGRATDALPILQRLAQGSSDPGLLRAEGAALDMVGQAQQAQMVYRRALLLAPIDADLHGNLALSLALSGDAEDALTEMQAAVASPDPDPRQDSNAVLVLALTGNTVAAQARGDASIGAAATAVLLARAQQALAASDPRARAAAIGVLTSNTAGPPPLDSTLLPLASTTPVALTEPADHPTAMVPSAQPAPPQTLSSSPPTDPSPPGILPAAQR